MGRAGVVDGVDDVLWCWDRPVHPPMAASGAVGKIAALVATRFAGSPVQAAEPPAPRMKLILQLSMGNETTHREFDLAGRWWRSGSFFPLTPSFSVGVRAKGALMPHEAVGVDYKPNTQTRSSLLSRAVRGPRSNAGIKPSTQHP